MQNFRRKHNEYKILSFVWAVILLFLALQPESNVEFFLPSDFLRNAAHAASYGVFSFLLGLFFIFRRRCLGLRVREKLGCALVFMATLGWGVITEMSQAFTADRTPDLHDLGFDAVGSLVSVMLFYLFLQFHRRHLAEKGSLLVGVSHASLQAINSQK